MYIQEIIIEGFKSYAQKTVVSGFDPQFNAITGLNGTGKSNILDSICFVLGIQNLSQVRVGNLQELVYKQGQAGVTKATVTIVFNNSDPSTSPVGYESSKQITVSRQVVIGGKNKYMINGHTVQQSQVQNMFHSVQLNVNNPHFLIMQGRITKVLNMKPEEIKSMIEEAAGTRMFETKKEAALKTIEKKQLKVDEITKCINEEITPTLENLRTERQDYHKWQENNVEYEHVLRLVVAFEYCTAQEKVQSSEQDQQKLIEEQDSYLKIQEEKHKEADECVVKINEIIRIRDSEVEGELQELKKIESELSKDVVKTNTLFTNQKESITTEKETLQSTTKQMETTTKHLNDKKKELTTATTQYEIREKEVQNAEKESNLLREKYQNAIAGVTDVTSNAELLSIPEQVGAWEKKEREATSQLKQNQQKSDHIKEVLKDLKKNNKNMTSSHSNLMKESETLKSQIHTVEEKLKKVTCNEADELKLRNKVSELTQSNATLRDTMETLNASLEARLAFNYKDPERGFDRNRVKGLLARLFRVNDSKVATALEITAGGKLYQVVIDNQETGSMLIKNGQLKTRTTFIPLNIISNRCIETDKVTRAKQIAKTMGGTANLALELIQFDESVRRAMEHTFGTTIICSSSDIAKTIAFDNTLRIKTVTLDGDSFDPAGTVTGGSKNQLGVLLTKMDECYKATEQYKRQEKEVKDIETQLKGMDRELSIMKELQTELVMKRHALKICEEKIGDSSYAQSMNQITDYENQLVTLDEESKALKSQSDRAKEELKKLKNAENNVKKQRENAMKEMENQVKASQKDVSKMKAELLTLKNKREALQAEVKSLSTELTLLKEQHTIAESAVARLSEEADTLATKLSNIKNEYEVAKQAVTKKTQELNKCSKEIRALEAEKEKFLKESQAASLEARKVTHKLKQWEKDSKEAAKSLQSLVKQHPWIDKEKAYFGKVGSDFDFTGKDLAKCSKRLKDLKTEQDKLAKKINKKVMGMIENAESEYEELNRKRQVILNDKAKIETVIEELDVKKQQALQATWVKVNRDFGSIFSMLLPGTTAKLEPPEGCTVNDGLEVKVAFNGVWKDSLTELSGGQRSLLALSLILALLLFKPAPMYILDEVDAALDLSHTQNIGMMLRTHFSSSQFIVVSLKEGMFNNANVIFRTKFIDGVSAVTRTVAGSKGNKANNNAVAMIAHHVEAEDPDEVEAAPQKKRGKSNNKKASGIENAGIEA